MSEPEIVNSWAVAFLRARELYTDGKLKGFAVVTRKVYEGNEFQRTPIGESGGLALLTYAHELALSMHGAQYAIALHFDDGVLAMVVSNK